MCLPAAIALARLASRALVTCASKYTSTRRSLRTSSRLVDHLVMPCRWAISASLLSLRPPGIGSGYAAVPPAYQSPPTRRDTEPGGRVTLQDVADRAGVSLSTASRVVSEGPRRVGSQLISRVNQAVAELGYSANLQARAVATGQSNMVGVVVHDIADPY